jgi:ABC-type enterochelin transport system ATPase subunit
MLISRHIAYLQLEPILTQKSDQLSGGQATTREQAAIIVSVIVH